MCSRRRIYFRGNPIEPITNAYSAWSLRKVNPNYTGNAIQVRRSSDNTLLNIGFIGNDLNTAALLAFVGAGNGFVITFYDQFGNRNFKQTTDSSQPMIVSSGNLVTENGKPSMSFNRSTQWMQVSSSTGLFNFLHNNLGAIFLVCRYGYSANPNTNYVLLANARDNGQTGFQIFYSDEAPRNNEYRYNVFKGVGGTTGTRNVQANAITPQIQVIQACLIDNQNTNAAERLSGFVNNGNIFKNNTLLNTPSLNNATNNLMLGRRPGSTTFWHYGTIQEVIIWKTIPNANNIRDNINNYWKTY